MSFLRGKRAGEWCGAGMAGWRRWTVPCTTAFMVATAGLAHAATFDSYIEGEPVARPSVAEELDSVLIAQDGHAGADWQADVTGEEVCSGCGACGGMHADGCQGGSWRRGHRHQGHGLLNKVLGPACPRWVAQFDALMLWQGNLPSRPIFTNTGNDLTALNANQLVSPVAVGPRFGLFFNVDECRTVEANYFIVDSFQAQRTLPFGSSPYAMNNIAGLTFADIDTASVTSTASFKSFELNWRRRDCCPLTWLCGFRWVEWNEGLDIVDTYTDASSAQGVDSVAVTTGNNLYGAQLGLDAMLWETHRWIRVDGVAKAGVFYNSTAYQRTSLLGDRAFGEFAAVADQTAFVGEVGINASVRFTSWLAWRAGYNLFWLSGVSTAAQQLSGTNQPPAANTLVNTSGSVLLHGVNTGLEARW